MFITHLLQDSIEARSWTATAGLFSSIVFLFLCLYAVSDRHLTVALRHIARCLYMPADLAGMTLLAFGNGAPDFFTAVFGASQAPEMILSGAVGAALFTFTVVFGLVIILQVRPPPTDIQVDGQQSEAIDAEVLQLTKIQIFPFFRNVLLCMLCSTALFIFLRIGTITFWMPLALLCIYLLNLSASIMAHIISHKRGTAIPEPIQEKKVDEMVEWTLWSFWSLSLAEKLVYLWNNLCGKDLPDNIILRTFSLISRVLRLPMTIILYLCVLPMEFPSFQTSPKSPESMTCDNGDIALLILNRLRLLVIPCTSLGLFGLVWNDGRHGLPFWLLIFGEAIVMTAVLWATSRWQGKPRLFVLHAIYAFITCLGFIYLISRELISCLRAFGTVIGVSSSTMGVLVLAWGNSFGDLVADTTMSRSGHLNMAIFGVFAAHIQNVLFTLGTAFLIATLESSTKSVSISKIDTKVFFGIAIVATVLLCSLTLVPTLGKFTLPRWWGFILLSFYATFAFVALLLEF